MSIVSPLASISLGCESTAKHDPTIECHLVFPDRSDGLRVALSLAFTLDGLDALRLQLVHRIGNRFVWAPEKQVSTCTARVRRLA